MNDGSRTADRAMSGEKLPYHSPELREHGTVKELTRSDGGNFCEELGFPPSYCDENGNPPTS